MITQRREKNWLDFVDWCRTRRLKALPAHPWTVAAYARWCETHCRRSNVSKRIEAIARAHLYYCAASPARHPTVVNTLRMIETRRHSHTKRAALFRAEDFAGPGRTKSAMSKAKAKAKITKSQRKTGRALRGSPRLVPRRPAGV